ncbi:MAG: radical SAM (seleno)protein TrsS [Thermodesulfobacteriota bacterium]
MKKRLEETVSLCPECLGRIAAHKIVEDGNIYLEKECPTHGQFRALLWRGEVENYLQWGKYGSAAVPPLRALKKSDRGCPYDCGLCSSHGANTCSMIMLVTDRCNMACPVCLADSMAAPSGDPDLKSVGKMYETILHSTGRPAIQLSGGEPTVREDLHEIVSLGKSMGFPHIVINSNGIRIAKDPAYVQKLAKAGAGTIYLQFDGLTDRVYRYTRGADLLALKIGAVKNCREFGIGVVLVPTVVPGHNDDQLGAVIGFAKEWMPTVRGVHFQPISYFGRYPRPPRDEDRITIPDILGRLESQSQGELKGEDFLPRRSESSYCSFSGLFVMRSGRLQPVSKRPKGERLPMAGNGRIPPWEKARSFMELHWKIQKKQEEPAAEDLGFLGKAYQEVASRGLAISCMPFQDAWTIDLNRLRNCCLHVATPDGNITPFCAYYLTSAGGKRIRHA